MDHVPHVGTLIYQYSILFNCRMNIPYSQSSEEETEAQQHELLAQSHKHATPAESDQDGT